MAKVALLTFIAILECGSEIKGLFEKKQTFKHTVTSLFIGKMF